MSRSAFTALRCLQETPGPVRFGSVFAFRKSLQPKRAFFDRARTSPHSPSPRALRLIDEKSRNAIPLSIPSGWDVFGVGSKNPPRGHGSRRRDGKCLRRGVDLGRRQKQKAGARGHGGICGGGFVGARGRGGCWVAETAGEGGSRRNLTRWICGREGSRRNLRRWICGREGSRRNLAWWSRCCQSSRQQVWLVVGIVFDPNGHEFATLVLAFFLRFSAQKIHHFGGDQHRRAPRSLHHPAEWFKIRRRQKIRQNDAARREVEKLSEYTLSSASPGEALEGRHPFPKMRWT